MDSQITIGVAVCPRLTATEPEAWPWHDRMGADLFVSQHTPQLLHNGNNYQIFVAKRQDGDGSNAVSGTVAKCKLIFAAFWGGKGWIEGN